MSEWQRVKDVFQAAVELPIGERAAWLEHACGDDLALRAEVASLLAADAEHDGAIEHAVVAAIEDVAGDTGTTMIGRRIGAWQIVDELGRGGMGTVFRAVRADDAYRADAAIKLIRGAAYDRELEGRFLSERQILATLRHPNIARLLDGGTTDDGLPYLVLERVDGRPIDEYCDAAGLDLRERVELVREVCRAVEHAHQRLVVHRDLKPSNILVTAEGRPKLLDFGIAKLLDPSQVEHTVAMTVEGQARLTPAYAAPEQVRGGDVTTATDVYALGVLLYRLLVGVLPFRVAGATRHEIERAICQTDPVRPSTAVARAAADNGGATSASARDRRRRLRGDLDNIILKAIAKEPERRYPSVRELDDDLGRYLLNQPVVARRSTWSYRSAKFVRRNRRVVVTVTLAVVVVAVIVSFYTARLAHERDRAELEAATAREVTDFLVKMFQQASPYVAQGEVVSALDMLEQGAREVDDLEGRPRLQAELLDVMGTAYSEIGGHDDVAIAMLARAVALRRALPDTDPLALATSLDHFSITYRVATRFDEAEPLAREAVAIRQRMLGPRHRDIAIALNHLGVLLYDMGRLEEARESQVEALEVFDALGEGAGPEAADSLNNLGITLDRLGDYRGAEGVHRRAIELHRKLLGDDYPATATCLANLGLVLVSLGRYAEAEGLFRESLETRRRVLGDLDWRTALGASNLTRALVPLGRFAEARELMNEALATTLKVDGGDHLQYARRLLDLGDLELAVGHLEAATTAYRDSLALYDRLSGVSSRHSDRLRCRLAAALRVAGRPQEGVALVQEVLAAGRSEEHGPDRELAAARGELLADLVALGHFDQAASLVPQVMADSERQLGPDSPRLAAVLIPAAAVAIAADRLPAALGHLERAVALRRAALGDDNWLTAAAMVELGHALIVAGRRSEAAATLGKATETLTAAFGADDGRVRRARKLLDAAQPAPS